MTDAAAPTDRFLSPYRVLDLSDHRGLIAGRIFAQLGADVVQLEPPEGSNARRIGPFDGDGRSMHWAAYAAGKRGVALALDDRDTLLALVKRADFIIESRGPNEPARLTPEEIAAANPAAIHMLITPFGLTGPKANDPATDLTLWAAGGPLLPTSVDGRAPMRISVPQAWHFAAADAVGGALIAHFARLQSGEGQRVEVSVQRAATQATLSASLAAAVGHEEYSFRPKYTTSKKKSVDMSGSGSRTQRSKWRSRDGLLEMHLAIGPATGRFTNSFMGWMKDCGALSPRFQDWDWSTIQHRMMADEITDEDMEAVRAEVGAFLKTLGRQEVVEQAIARKLLLAPVATIPDLIASPHEVARGFFQSVADTKGVETLLPGDFAITDRPGFAPPRPAPGIDEHGQDVRRDWLGAPAAPLVGKTSSDKPLAGLKVLDFAWVVAGPMLGRNLSDFGATVVRVETARRAETARAIGPFPGGATDFNRSSLFENCNAGKLGLSLDMSREDAREVARDAAAWADIAVESFAPGQMDRWGMGYAALSARNPGLIMLSTALMGQSGPWKGLAGFGNIGAAMAGFQALAGPEDGLPIGPFGPYTDYVAPRFGLPMLLAALDDRRRTGKGLRIDLAQAEAGMQFIASAIADFGATGRVAKAMGNRDPQMAPHGVYLCRPAGQTQRWLALAATDDAAWRALAGQIGGAALDDRFAALPGRKTHEDALEAIVAGWAAGLGAEEAAAIARGAGVAAHIAASSEDLRDDPQLRAQGHFIALPQPQGATVVEACRFTLSATPGAPAGPAPLVGGDTTRVLREFLGYGDARIAALADAGALV